jgi:HSP20 family molecular chaperone IbpA
MGSSIWSLDLSKKSFFLCNTPMAHQCSRDRPGQDYQETSYGKFERAVTLPQGVETDKISARCEHGVLEIRVPVPTQLAGREDSD